MFQPRQFQHLGPLAPPHHMNTTTPFETTRTLQAQSEDQVFTDERLMEMIQTDDLDGVGVLRKRYAAAPTRTLQQAIGPIYNQAMQHLNRTQTSAVLLPVSPPVSEQKTGTPQ